MVQAPTFICFVLFYLLLRHFECALRWQIADHLKLPPSMPEAQRKEMSEQFAEEHGFVSRPHTVKKWAEAGILEYDAVLQNLDTKFNSQQDMKQVDLDSVMGNTQVQRALADQPLVKVKIENPRWQEFKRNVSTMGSANATIAKELHGLRAAWLRLASIEETQKAAADFDPSESVGVHATAAKDALELAQKLADKVSEEILNFEAINKATDPEQMEIHMQAVKKAITGASELVEQIKMHKKKAIQAIP